MKKFILLCLAILFFLPTIFCSKKQTKSSKQNDTSISISDSYDLTLNDGYRKAVNKYGYRLGTMAWKGEYPVLYRDTTIQYSILGFQKKIYVETVYLKKILEKDQFVIIEEIVPSGKWEFNYIVFYAWILIFSTFFIANHFESKPIQKRFNYSLYITIAYLLPIYLSVYDYQFFLSPVVIFTILVVVSILLIILGIDFLPIMIAIFGFIYLIYMLKFLPIIIGIILFLLSLLIFRNPRSSNKTWFYGY